MLADHESFVTDASAAPKTLLETAMGKLNGSRAQAQAPLVKRPPEFVTLKYNHQKFSNV
jgi:hypothetical protein